MDSLINLQPGLEREQTEKLLREMQALKLKLDSLENENVALKKSIYDLSARYSASRQRAGPFLIDYDEDAELEPELLEKADSLGREVSESLGHAPRDRQKDNRILMLKHDLKNHNGAVYTVKYSPSGRLLASGSFDKTVRIWEHQKEVACFRKHTLNVSDLSWTSDSTELLSGSYDQTCKIWAPGSEKMKASYDCDGFVQAVMFNPQDNNVFAAGTSRNKLVLYDQRSTQPIQSFELDAMVNSLYFCSDGATLISGDSSGNIDAWSLPAGAYTNEHGHKPISHLSGCRSAADREEDTPYFAVNSYDNVIRVYQRNQDAESMSLRLLQSLKGCKNKNWPIRSALFEGRERKPATRVSLAPGKRKRRPVCLSLRCGRPRGRLPQYFMGTGHLLQRLEGHTDRVYSVDFHPTEPILCSCSADATIKIWAPVGRAKKKRDPIHL
ncbi:WD40-repeat-containing domain protein [Thamnocephalis sphaerospora]|uniref:WD40-repeat-containing domain protein n=1 Tax=Thamnocephalis sphaerospora TaxID=78915 RepID=A0A4P9XX37_9FUNG|nr:WD40-repeat-containing domain protein [Thamnocephalis sphaerospora]|eukprot:RKP10857.1 WD40-repeat-containing domain protein [Thamnocephalis sphaerospora]